MEGCSESGYLASIQCVEVGCDLGGLKMNLLFYRAKYGNWKDWIISWTTWGPFSHVELQFSDGECFSASPRDGGVRFKHIDLHLAHWVRVPIKLEETDELRAWCESQCDKEYDWWGVLTYFSPIDIQDWDKWYCSELLAYGINRYSRIQSVPMKASANTLYRIFT